MSVSQKYKVIRGDQVAIRVAGISEMIGFREALQFSSSIVSQEEEITAWKLGLIILCNSERFITAVKQDGKQSALRKKIETQDKNQAKR